MSHLLFVKLHDRILLIILLVVFTLAPVYLALEYHDFPDIQQISKFCLLYAAGNFIALIGVIRRQGWANRLAGILAIIGLIVSVLYFFSTLMQLNGASLFALVAIPFEFTAFLAADRERKRLSQSLSEITNTGSREA